MKTKVAIQGGLGSFHHQVASRVFDEHTCEFIDCDHFRDIAKAVENEEVAYGLMAIENSLAGSILPNYNLMQKHNLFITQEVLMPISLHFMTLPGQNVANINSVYSHPIALLQCDDFLDQYPHIHRIEYDDTAKSAQMIREKNLAGVAAIASIKAAELYDLEVLASDIQTHKNNVTRFVVLEKQMKSAGDYNKVSLRFTLPHQSGILANVLMQFSVRQMNLSKIQSLPIIGKPWQYEFYIDVWVDEHAKLDEVLDIIHHMTEDVTLLGKYKRVESEFT